MNNEDKVKNYNGGCPIPGYSLTQDGDKISDDRIKMWLMQFIENEGAAYGYWKLTKALQKYLNLIINKKKVYRLCKELNILRPQREIKRKYPRKIAKSRTITGPNQLWEVDIKYGYILGEDRFFFLLSYIDIFDRNIVDYHIGHSCSGQDASVTLKRALLRRNLFTQENKPVIRSDNGPQFISNVFENTCNELNIEHERITIKSPNYNAHIESYHSILEDECLSRYEFRNYCEAYEAVVQFVEFYNNRRIHESIYGLSPMEYYKGVISNTVKPLKIKV